MQEITYCLSCKKDNRKIVLFATCSICNNKKSAFISQESGLFDNLVSNTTQNRMKDSLWNAFNKW